MKRTYKNFTKNLIVKQSLSLTFLLTRITKPRFIPVICFLYLVLLTSNIYAQTGNWNGSTTTTTTTPNDVGIGTTGPDGKTEIFIGCNPKNGLVVTKDEDCPIPYFNPISYGNAEVYDPNNPPPPPSNEFILPFSYYVGSTLPMTFVSGTGGYTAPITNNPLIWARTKGLHYTNGSLYSNTRFVVMPDGKTGINVYNPRATLDVRNMNGGKNLPAAIFGVNVNTTHNNALQEIYNSKPVMFK